ncbi:unnamed protein product [Mytilus edulis]|uniref:Endonuclease-reverse transcriptase n=1 Tax=Mytilus edulis TaxID=6550 RepID=A0A8S3V2V1_MYTED|nr:unnamed protein product [Mytilus edulis]
MNTLSRHRLEEKHDFNRKQQMTRRPMELFSTKLTTRIGTWNVRTLYQSGKCAQVTKEMDRYKIEILGLSEVRWNTSGMTNLNTGHTIIYSGNTKQNDHTKREKGWHREIGPNGIGKINENGKLFADFCATNKLVIGGTLFKHKNCHKVTWVSPAGNAENQIDHITISQRWRSSLQDVRIKRGADAASDHHLVIGSIKMKLLAQKKLVVKRRKFNVGKLKIPNIREVFQISLQNRFSAISDLVIEENDINNTWEQTNNVILETCEETLGYMQYKHKNWMSDNTWVKVEERRIAKEKVLNATTRQQKRQTQDLYIEKDKEVKKNCKQDKRNYVEQLAQEAEITCSKGDMKYPYNTTKQLSGRRSNSNATVKEKNGNVITKIEKQLKRWKYHFEEVLNRPPPTDPPNIEGDRS